eukprot:TRINITY_DN9880_c0_g1_i1.p1 TRINITY_DN9880_c0_g1~~TRINITY_DN9880_c0_g1_i1.p1  ORF type:complete len:128 (+),score=27.33 TRINITY_DN9880_c0_g1_i1:28-384(+)
MATRTPHQQQVLQLYRRLLKEAKLMPTGNQKSWLVGKIKHEFRKNKDVDDPKQLEFLMNYGEVSLDSVIVQRKHLNDLFGSSDNVSSTTTPERTSQHKRNKHDYADEFFEFVEDPKKP